MVVGDQSSSFSSSPLPLSLPLQLNPNNNSWIPLQTLPLFKSTDPITISKEASNTNLVAYDAATSRLYVWDQRTFSVHRIHIRLSSEDEDEGEETGMVMAENRTEVLVPSVRVGNKEVNWIGINADGSCLVLCGRDFVSFMILYDKVSSVGNTITYRTSSIGSQMFSHRNGLQVLQVSWHPFSCNHVGILSSDSVLRLFDLSSDLEQPEQEFYLQPFYFGSSKKAASICPVAFVFGDQHLWDRFSIFILFSDGSAYVLCPVVPFGSLCKLTFLEELYEDVKEFGLKSSNTNIVSNSNLALDWLESTFLELGNRSVDGTSKLVSRAQPYAPVDSSLILQGPLSKVKNEKDQDDTGVSGQDCKGKAVCFLYSSINKDSVLATVWSSGQLQFDALADEILPVWNMGSSPHLHVDSHGRINGIAMICESNFQESSVGMGPPLLRLAIVDLALPKNALDNCPLALYQDPLLSERFYCVHSAGVDSISLHYLPFSNLLEKTDKIVKEPSVFPVLSTSHGESFSKLSICGFAAIANTCGSSQIIGITSSYDCIVLESKALVDAAPYCDMDMIESDSSVNRGDEVSGVISEVLLSGPKAIDIPLMANLRTLTADSIEGRSALHHYIKLFHENYVEYAHKVFIELEHHEKYTKMVVNNQNDRINKAKQSLLNVENKEQGIRDRIDRAYKVYELLEERLQNFRMLPGAKMKPLSRAEHQFKAQLDRFSDVELDALRSSIDALNARLKRSTKSSLISAKNLKGKPPLRRLNQVSDNQIEKIRSSLQMLTVINSENTKKVDLIEHGLKKVIE